MYTKDLLREYISNSELRIYNDNIKVRLSKELATKYDNGVYDNYLNNLERYYTMINNLGIVYPSNARPVLYLYIVPDENYEEYLSTPKVFRGGNGGGKPVTCYDIDGFNSAYGISQNLCVNRSNNENISVVVNNVHELAHLVHGQYFNVDRMINEGFAETLPLYVMGLEDKFEDHREALLNMDENQIYSAKELLISGKDGSYGKEALIPNRSCSFRLSYISSYLFVRFCLEEIGRKFNLNRINSIMYFLNYVKTSRCSDDDLIFELAHLLEVDRNELLNTKKYQLEVLENISKINDINKK